MYVKITAYMKRVDTSFTGKNATKNELQYLSNKTNKQMERYIEF